MELETVDHPVALIHLEELDALRNETHRLKEEVASLGLKAENGQLREENLRLKFELQAVQLKDEIQRLRDENLQLREDNGRLKEEVGQLKTENAKLRAENLRLEGESLALGRVHTARVSASQDKRASQKHSPVIHSTAPSFAHRGRRTRSSQRLDSKHGSNNDLDVGEDGLLRGITVFARGENDDNAGDDFEDADPEELSIGSDNSGNDTSFNSDVAAGGLNITVSETMDMRDAIVKQESGWGGEAMDVSLQEESVQPEGAGKGKRGRRTGASTRGKRRELERAAAITQPSTSESQMHVSTVTIKREEDTACADEGESEDIQTLVPPALLNSTGHDPLVPATKQLWHESPPTHVETEPRPLVHEDASAVNNTGDSLLAHVKIEPSPLVHQNTSTVNSAGGSPPSHVRTEPSPLVHEDFGMVNNADGSPPSHVRTEPSPLVQQDVGAVNNAGGSPPSHIRTEPSPLVHEDVGTVNNAGGSPFSHVRTEPSPLVHEDVGTVNNAGSSKRKRGKRAAEDGTCQLYMCGECDKIYKHIRALRYHTRKIHCRNGGPKFKCEFCEKAFMASDNLAAHMNIQHLKRKPYECQGCHKSFYSKKNAAPQRHRCGAREQEQSGSPIVCELCQKQFTTRQNLKDHYIVHSRTPNYSCKKCHKAFLYRSELSRHRKKCSAH